MDELTRDELEKLLRANLLAGVSTLAEQLASASTHRGYENPVYRFYHQSFKVYYLQEETLKIVEALQSLLPGMPLNPWFVQIVREGTGKEFTPEDNERWLAATRPIVEAFFHARYFLEMAVRYGHAPEEQPMPSGWAALLYLFNLR